MTTIRHLIPQLLFAAAFGATFTSLAATAGLTHAAIVALAGSLGGLLVAGLLYLVERLS